MWMRRHVGSFVALIALATTAHGDGSIAEDYAWVLPRGLPIPSAPAGNPMSAAKVQLGCRLFFDRSLSINEKQSCATCHRPELAFTDGLARSVGTTGAVLPRNAMTLANVAYSPALTWANSRAVTLERQSDVPLFAEHPVEMGLQGAGEPAIERLTRDAGYRDAFQQSFPDDPKSLSIANVQRALAAFERTLISGRSAFDRYVYDDERTALTPDAQRGMALFFSPRAGCSACHSGPNFSGPIVTRERPTPRAAFARNGIALDADTGLASITHDSRDSGQFRIPTLRNIAVTAPYMHDGRFSKLEEAVEHYASDDGIAAASAAAAHVERLSSEEQQLLIAFLNSLTDHEFLQRDYTACGATSGN
jgi:cytochrome c peroxidase